MKLRPTQKERAENAREYHRLLGINALSDKPCGCLIALFDGRKEPRRWHCNKHKKKPYQHKAPTDCKCGYIKKKKLVEQTRWKFIIGENEEAEKVQQERRDHECPEKY